MSCNPFKRRPSLFNDSWLLGGTHLRNVGRYSKPLCLDDEGRVRE